MACGVQHHLNDTLYVPVHRFQAPDVHAETPRNRRADLLRIQSFSLNLAASNYILSESLENRLLAKLEAEGFHVADQAALLVTDGCQEFCEVLSVPMKPRPFRTVVNIPSHYPHPLRRL
jgi:hypothetical protein